MKRIAGVINTHFLGKWLLALGWLIALPSFLVNFTIAVMVNHEQAFYVGGFCTIYLTTFITGITSFTQTFPFALGFSASRRDYFIGTAGTYTFVSAVSAALLVVMTLVEKQLGGWGQHFYFFSLPWLNDGTAWQQFFVSFVMLEFLYFLGFMIGAMYQRFGTRGPLLFSSAVMVLSTAAVLLATLYGWWHPMWNWLVRHTAAQLAWWFLALAVIQASAAYTMLRRAAV